RQFLEGLISEKPDRGEDVVIEYRDKSGNWRRIHRLEGRGTGGQQFKFTGPDTLTISDKRALHKHLRIRFRFTGGSGPYSTPHHTRYNDWWYADNIKLEKIGKQVPFLMTVGNLLNES